MSYNGVVRGIWPELLNLGGIIIATAIAMNYHGLVAGWLHAGTWFGWRVGAFLTFCLLFLSLTFVVHVVARRVSELMPGGQFNWPIRGLGLLVGGARGFWWAGLILAVLVSTGVTYLQESVTHSLTGPRIEPVARRVMTRVVGRFPGARPEGLRLPHLN